MSDTPIASNTDKAPVYVEIDKLSETLGALEEVSHTLFMRLKTVTMDQAEVKDVAGDPPQTPASTLEHNIRDVCLRTQRLLDDTRSVLSRIRV